ncbi:sulfate respiration complex hexadecaheme cytochrome HmcA [Thermodesulfovibrio sp.]|uniref:sulfate respiration complex hexadecaheme cytochrome HmcA n=1 Tax=Thermodesulfovibrio sp. TaxID=2067987 RepID=UPI0030AD55A8
MKKTLFLLALISIALISVNKLYSKNSAGKSYEENIIPIAHEEIFGKLEYGKVLFKHQKHIESIAAITNKSQQQTCIECHKKSNSDDYTFYFMAEEFKKNPEELKDIYHKECLRCHQKLSAEGKKGGPEILSCRDCHKKEYKRVEVKYPYFEFDFSIHDKHVNKLAKDCSLCHHIYDVEEKNKELALVYEKGKEQSCYYCHDFSKKRGPELTKITEVAKQKNLNMQKASHQLCVNCHMHNKQEGKDGGPIVCSKCHTGKYKTLSDLKNVPRPEVNQPEVVFISIDEGKMRGVSFKHSFHEQKNKTCRSCHHETLKPCRDCHTLEGSIDGGFVNLTTAYHSLQSEISCQGCHKELLNRKECIGCHYFIAPIKVEIGRKDICDKCHRGRQEDKKVSASSLKGDGKIKFKEEVVIKHLEKEFESVKMPHGKMIRKLYEISEQSRLAKLFHGNSDTLCRGCHHKSKEKAERESEKPPLCISCHGIQFSERDKTRPRLEASYHGMCIKCHESMQLEKPKKCTDCHERKVMANVRN